MMKKITLIICCTAFSLFASMNEELLNAVRADDNETAKRLLEGGANPNAHKVDVTIERYKIKPDLTQYSDDAQGREAPRDNPNEKVFIKGKISQASCLFFALDNNNMEMASLLMLYNVDYKALITFKGVEIIEEIVSACRRTKEVKKHSITQTAGALSQTLRDMLGLYFLTADKTRKKIAG